MVRVVFLTIIPRAQMGHESTQAAQTLFVIYIRDSIALRFEPFMYENGSEIALNSTCSKGFK